MDKNSTIGFLLIFLIFIGYYFINKPSEEELNRARELAQRRRDSIEQLETKRKEEIKKTEEVALNDSTSPKSDSLQNEELKNLYGAFAAASKGENEEIVLENSKIRAVISTKGGAIRSVKLKEFKRYDSTDVVLFDGDENKFNFTFFSQNRNLNTKDLFFVAETNNKEIIVDNKEKSLKLKAKVSQNKYIEFVYSLKAESYLLDYSVNFVGLEGIIAANSSYIDLKWSVNSPGHEKGREWENDNTAIYYQILDDEVENLSERSDSENEKISVKLKWVAFKQQFFSAALIAKNSFEEGNLAQKRYKQGEYLKSFVADLSVPFEGDKTQSIPFSFYFGPNKYKLLKNIMPDEDLRLEKLVPLGWGIFGWVNRIAIIPLFNFLGSFMSNYGLIILLMTIIIKLVLFPLTYKSYLSSAKMRVLKPQIEEINKKIPAEKAMERQQATMKLYKKAGVNPMGGCLPMLLQMPILIAMYRFFPASIELRQKSFLWAEDLSTYDSVLDLPFSIPWYGDHISLFCLLMAASMILTTKMNSSQMDTGNSQMPSMKIMMYMMPVMMLLWFNNYSSGLSYYYLVTNIISFGQTILIRNFVDDKEILKKIELSKKKPVKKSNFQKRLEEMAKQKGYKLPPK